MKPGDHPDFFRLPPPPGASRESTIRLDDQGRFWHDGAMVENAALAKALHGWISRHPDDGRYVLTNGYDWTYFVVDDAPYYVVRAEVRPEGVWLTLSDQTQEWLAPERMRAGEGGAIYVGVKGGEFEAKFTRHAQTSLGSALEEDEAGEVVLVVGGRRYGLPQP